MIENKPLRNQGLFAFYEDRKFQQKRGIQVILKDIIGKRIETFSGLNETIISKRGIMLKCESGNTIIPTDIHCVYIPGGIEFLSFSEKELSAIDNYIQKIKY